MGQANKDAKKKVIDARNSAYGEINKLVQDGGSGIIDKGLLGQYLMYSELQNRDELNIMYDVPKTITDMRQSQFNEFDPAPEQQSTRRGY